MRKFLIFRHLGIFALLFAVLLLPMLHRHRAYDHAHGEAEEHQHQAALHADFFPDVTHGHEHHDDHELDVEDIDISIDSSHHTLSEINLLSPHIGQSFQFSSVFKKDLLALAQVSFDFSIFSNFRRGVPNHQHAPPTQAPQFSLPSLRAPPYFA